MDNIPEGLLTMSNPEDRPEIAKLKDDVSIPCALVQKVRGSGAQTPGLRSRPAHPPAAACMAELSTTSLVAGP